MRFELTLTYQFLPASFRGVPFKVVEAETAVGRRTVVHEFVARNTPYPEDMGRATTDFVIEGFIIGDDYLEGKKRLIEALTQEGPGTLIHPSFGTLQVSLVNKARMRENFITSRGRVTFTLAFVEAGDAAQPSTRIDTQQKVVRAADGCYGPMFGDFSNVFSIDGMPSWSVDSIIGEVGQITDVIANIRNSLQFNLAPLSALIRAGNELKANIIDLVAMPNAFATELSVQIRGMVDLFDFNAAQIQIFGNPRGSSRPLTNLLPLSDYGQPSSAFARPTIAPSTPVRAQQALNQEAVFALIARTAVVEAARSSIYIPFESVQEANEVRDQLYDALDTLMLDASDSVYQSLQDLQVAVVRDITTRGANLARLSTLVNPGSVPARVLSYRLYGTGEYADEIVSRNQQPGNLLHPLFMPGATPLEVRLV